MVYVQDVRQKTERYCEGNLAWQTYMHCAVKEKECDMRKEWTVDDILALRPCGWDKPNGVGYHHARLVELFAGRRTVTLLDVLDVDIPLEDKVWLIPRMLTASQRVRWVDLIMMRARKRTAAVWAKAVWAAWAAARGAAWSVDKEYERQIADCRLVLAEGEGGGNRNERKSRT